ncbi:ATP-dependent translocase ABCB1-like isoform X3 [Daktulosphaira vitifoliae]|nr:ATP-dependent translocase ABCB1-like isoform X3 [Daktulosphaira vitifoliae]XP_050546776.1 ATP-dependent translocase ABCB1-like isoform X3 [Daktulosphaira vitifoliae]XP_050546777.1 ATP-dependent translocase ABCB1-like isoform X3 [Daktulosphaira vitifoliae]XP_050546778.1 ATP-dependent translocase ABCB1-like isoform X3 [Daktulosphaira vitifoliae]XP_050546779.1 ATP-dependent translocase ABCB1-like isoform X3 [Daktulosphaira vitifoliae]
MFIGLIFAIIHGSSFPILALVFGQMTNAFIKQSLSLNQSKNFSFSYLPSPVNLDRIQIINLNVSNSIPLYDENFSLPNEQNFSYDPFFMSKIEKLTSTINSSVMNLESNIKDFIQPNISVDVGSFNSEEFYDSMKNFSYYFLLIGLGVFTTTFLQIFCWEMACENQINQFCKKLFRQVLRYNFNSLNDKGELSIQLTNDLVKIHEGIGSKFSMIIQHSSTFFSGVIVGFIVNWRLTIPLLCVAPILISLYYAVSKISETTILREHIKYESAGKVANEVLSNIKTVAAFGREIKELERYEMALEEGRKLVMKKYFIFAILLGSVFLIIYSLHGILFWYDSNLIIAGISTPGSLYTVLFSVMVGVYSIGNVLPIFNLVSIAIDSASTVFGIIDYIPNIDPYSLEGKKIKKIKGKIEFKNVSFVCPKNASSVLNNLSLTIESKKTIAIVGSNESGKNVIASLLMRFCDPKEGEILLDNINLKELNVHWLRKNIGIVSQEPVLFNASISDNIRYGQSKCSQRDIINAAMAANAHSFIIKLPKGYDTLVGDLGTELSREQKYKITIARTLIKNPKILLLDEVDLPTDGEEIMKNTLEKIWKNRSTIILTQKLSTLKNIDVIYVLQEGNVVEIGTHDSLIAKNGFYSCLFNIQPKLRNTYDEKLEKPIILEQNDILELTQQIEPNQHTCLEVNNRGNIKAQEKSTHSYNKSLSIYENIEEPEKVYSVDNFTIEESDGCKIKVTKKVTTSKIKRIIYSDQGTLTDNEKIYIRQSSMNRKYSKINKYDDYSQWESSDLEVLKDAYKTNNFAEKDCSTKEFQNLNNVEYFNFYNCIGTNFLLKLNSPEWSWLMIGFLGCALTGLIVPIFGFLYGQIFATLTLEGEYLLDEAAFWSKMFIVLAIISAIAWWLKTIGLTTASEKLIMQIRINTFENILRQPIYWFEFKNSHPNTLINKLAKEAPLIKSVASLRVSQIISIIVTTSVGLIISFGLGWKISIVLVFGVPLIIISINKQFILLRKIQKRIYNNNTSKIASEIIENIYTIQCLAQEQMFIDQYEYSLGIPFIAKKKKVFIYSLVYALSLAIMYAIHAIIFRYGAYLVVVEEISSTNIYRVFFVLTFCALSVGHTSIYLQGYYRGKTAVNLIFQLILRKSEIDPLSKSGLKPEIRGKVLLKDIWFIYPSKPDVEVLKGLNFTIKSGKTLALIGDSGCGKSTVFSLIERFYNPTAGVIEIDNYDIHALNLHHLRNNIGVVFQESVLFNCSIKDNISFGINDRNVSMNEIIGAAKKANIHNFISSLAQRYDTLIGGKNYQFSVCQKQCIAIARALLRNPKILLIDEATTALDTESDQLMIHEAINKARIGRTCIIISYRLHTIKLADSIAVIQNGKVVELGSHEELKALKSHYYELIKKQDEWIKA